MLTELAPVRTVLAAACESAVELQKRATSVMVAVPAGLLEAKVCWYSTVLLPRLVLVIEAAVITTEPVEATSEVSFEVAAVLPVPILQAEIKVEALTPAPEPTIDARLAKPNVHMMFSTQSVWCLTLPSGPRTANRTLFLKPGAA